MKTTGIVIASIISAYMVTSTSEIKEEPNSQYFNLETTRNNEFFVKDLDLNNSAITEVPFELKNFHFIERLNLSNNDIVAVSDVFEKLQNLTKVDLSGNENIDLRTSIPTLAKSENIQTLLLQKCNLFFLPNNIELLKNLEHLDVSNNYIMEFPYFMSKLTNLKSVDASNNNLFELGYAPSLWENLEYINLKGNDSLDIENTFLALSFLENLKQIEISNVSEVPEIVQDLHCKEIVFENSSLKKIPKSIEENKTIKEISFNSSREANFEKVIDKIGNINQLEAVHFNDCLEEVPRNLKKLPQLTELDLSNNGLSSLDISSEEFPNLKSLNISGNNLSKESVELIKKEFPNCQIISEFQNPINKCAKVTPPFENLDIAPDNYKVSPEESTKISHNNTEIKIPENAFLSEDGEVITSPVDIEYREFHDPVDVIFSGIPMGYDSAGVTYNLETSGMIEFRAFSEGKEVFPNPESSIQVNLGSEVIKDGYNIYLLDDETGEWKFQDVSVMLDSTGNEITAEEIQLLKDNDTLVKPQSLDKLVRAPSIFPENQFFNIKKIKGTRLFKMNFTNSGYAGTADFQKKYLTRKLLQKFDLIYAGKDRREFSGFLKQFNKAGRFIVAKDYSYFVDTRLELDKENDQFNFIVDYIDTTLSIPVYVRPRLKSIEKEQKFNVRFWKYYKKLKKKEARDQLKQERRFRYALKKFEINNTSVQNTNRANLTKKKKKFRPLGLLARPIALLTFGIVNTDCAPPIIEVETELRQIEMIAIDSKEQVYPDKITVINKKRNSFKTYDIQNVPFENSRNSSLLVRLLDGRIGFIKSSDLRPLLRNKRLSVQIPLTVVDPEEVALTEIRKMILG